MMIISITCLLLVSVRNSLPSHGFAIPKVSTGRLVQPQFMSLAPTVNQQHIVSTVPSYSRAISGSTHLHATLLQQQDIEVIKLVAGQENYGLAVVCVGEAIWSFLSAPSVDHIKVLIPAGIAAAVLVLVSGPMITSGDVDSIGTGLWIATATSTALGVSYVARMIAPYSPSPKEIAGLGLLVAIAGFFSFAQNLLVDGFVVLPSLPSIELPDLSSIVGTSTVDLPDMASASPLVPLEAQPQPIELPAPAPELNLEAVSDIVSTVAETPQ